MQVVEFRTALTSGLMLLAAVSGVVVRVMGRPLNIAVSTIHKLIAVASVVFGILLINAMAKAAPLASPVFALIVVSGLLILSLFATGAFLSSDKPVNAALRTTHMIVPFLAFASTLLMAYLHLRRGL